MKLEFAFSLTLSGIIIFAVPGLCAEPGLGNEPSLYLLNASDKYHLNTNKVWESAFLNSGEIKSELSKFLPGMDASKLQSELFKKFGKIIMEDTIAQQNPYSVRVNDIPSLSFHQQFFLSDLHAFMETLQKNKKSKISREALRPFMKIIRNASLHAYELSQEYPLRVSAVRRTNSFLEHFEDIAKVSSNPTLKREYSEALRTDQLERDKAQKDLQDYRTEIETLTGTKLEELF